VRFLLDLKIQFWLLANSKHFGAANFAGRFSGWFAILQSHFLNVFSVSFGAAFHTIEICH